MKIEQIDVYHVAMPMKAAWRTAFGEMDRIDSILVRLVADGFVGWGEAAPYAAPQYCPEFAAGAFAIIRDWLGPAILGQEILDGESLQAHLATFKGNQFAKAAIDIAWWDAFAQQRDMPLWKLIGGKSPRVAVGADIPVLENLDLLFHAIDDALEARFGRIKLKFRAGWGPEMIHRVRKTFPEAVIHIDCNSGFSLQDAAMFEELDSLNLAMIEQPLAHDDLIDHARLQKRLRTPICLDESIVSLDRARKAISIGAGRWINLKVGRLGGLTPAISVHDYCRERGVPCWVGGMLESGVGQGPSIALATLNNIAYPADIFPSNRFYVEDLSTPDVLLADPGLVEAPDRPGHGFVPVQERLERSTVQHAAIEPRDAH
jgi:O-succinylbenzoate synthase